MTAGPILSAADIERFGPDPSATFRANLAAVEDRIAKACVRAGRERSSVRLLPVTKTVPAHVLRLAFEAGIDTFGENKIQEAMKKREALSELCVHWSIIGHLQTNKARHLTGLAEEFHALDSIRLAEALHARLESDGRSIGTYIQVNTSGEDTKFGLAPHELASFLDALRGFPLIRPLGLMTLALFSPDMEKVRPCFSMLRTLRDEARVKHPEIDGLSMGMTGDFEVAIEEGATVVRVGQAIFGKRPTPDGYYWPGLTAH